MEQLKKQFFYILEKRNKFLELKKYIQSILEKTKKINFKTKFQNDENWNSWKQDIEFDFINSSWNELEKEIDDFEKKPVQKLLNIKNVLNEIKNEKQFNLKMINDFYEVIDAIGGNFQLSVGNHLFEKINREFFKFFELIVSKQSDEKVKEFIKENFTIKNKQIENYKNVRFVDNTFEFMNEKVIVDKRIFEYAKYVCGENNIFPKSKIFNVVVCSSCEFKEISIVFNNNEFVVGYLWDIKENLISKQKQINETLKIEIEFQEFMKKEKRREEYESYEDFVEILDVVHIMNKTKYLNSLFDKFEVMWKYEIIEYNKQQKFNFFNNEILNVLNMESYYRYREDYDEIWHEKEIVWKQTSDEKQIEGFMFKIKNYIKTEFKENLEQYWNNFHNEFQYIEYVFNIIFKKFNIDEQMEIKCEKIIDVLNERKEFLIEFAKNRNLEW